MIIPSMPFAAAAALACLVAALSSGAARAAETVPDAAAAPDPGAADAVERGRYLAIAADCAGCHTRDGGEAFSGGQAIESPLGTLYTANITPDPETGIGRWTEADFRRALWEGRDDEGHYIYPAMPYDSYTKLTEADVSDLWAWARSLEPVPYTPPDNDMVFPANIREGLAVWQELEFEPGRFVPEPGRGAEYNRGAYLVEGAGHCGACHTPRDALLGSDDTRRFTGAEIHGWYAPSIAPVASSGIADWDVDQLATWLATGTNDTNQVVVGEMAAVVHGSLSKLTSADVRAIATYLKEMPAPERVPDTAPTSEPRPARRAAGRALYAAHCLSCHQAGGRGIEGAVPSLVDNGAVTAPEGDDVVMLMLEGHSSDGTWAAMPSFARTLSARDVADVANYVRTAWGNAGDPNVTPDKVGELLAQASLPEHGQQPGIDCPVLDGPRMAPALAVTAGGFDGVEDDPGRVAGMVDGYREARADSSTEELVLALSSAYCRSLAAEPMSLPEQQGRVAAFAGRVAEIARAGSR